MRSAQHWHVVSTQRSAGWGKGRESLRGPSTGQLPTACSYLLPRFCRLPPPGLSSASSQRKPSQGCPKSPTGIRASGARRVVCSQLEGSHLLSNLTSGQESRMPGPHLLLQKLLECFP